MKKKIENREDIVLMVNTFYDKVQSNDVIGYIFNDVAKTDWEHHLPKMYSFWSSILLGEHSYAGNPMKIHIDLSKITSMTEVEFSVWRNIFNENIDNLFEGDKAEEAKTRAANIARLMLNNIQVS